MWMWLRLSSESHTSLFEAQVGIWFNPKLHNGPYLVDAVAKSFKKVTNLKFFYRLMNTSDSWLSMLTSWAYAIRKKSVFLWPFKQM